MAKHYGMCFGVRDALAEAERVASRRPATILGELVHNEVVMERLDKAGVREGQLEAEGAPTPDVIVTAHGASDRERKRWANIGYRVTDTTCPLVRKAHVALVGPGGIHPGSDWKARPCGSPGINGRFPGNLRDP